MANGQILRGEVYWVCVDGSIGSEQQTGRPALIISGDKANEKRNTVIVAYMTTGGVGNYSSVTVNYCGKPERVLCDQIRTIDKQRLTRYVGRLTEAEMRRVSGGLAVCMCLRTDGVGCEDVFDKDESEELLALRAESDMWKLLYEKTMNQLVDFKVDADLKLRLAQRTPVVEQPVAVVEEEPVVVEQPVVEAPKPVEVEVEQPPEKVDLNSCTVEDLKKCGCTEAVARLIIVGRPYMLVDDLRRIPGITNVGFGLLKHKVCANPVIVEEEPEAMEEPEAEVVEEAPVVIEEPPVVAVAEEPEKVNINTATPKELREKLGIGTFYSYVITGYRNKNGRYVDLKELLEVRDLPKNFLEKYGDRLTIGEVETPTEAPGVVEDLADPDTDDDEGESVAVEKVNVNTASAKELSEALGLSLNVCYAITGKRKRDGLFTSLEQIVVPNRFTEAMLEKNRDKLTLGEPQSEEPAEKKLNINMASLRELMDLGFEKRAAALIVNERKKFGNFRSVDDLAEIPEISGKILRKLRDKLEV